MINNLDNILNTIKQNSELKPKDIITAVIIYLGEDLSTVINSIPTDIKVIACKTVKGGVSRFIETKGRVSYYEYGYDEFDFSKARNYAKEQANSEWILSLDADDILTDTYENLLFAIDTKKDAVQCCIYSPERIDGHCLPTKILHSIRLFKKQLNWKYNIHELIDYPNPDSCDVLIKHTGYIADFKTMYGKCLRNINMLLQSDDLGDKYHLDYLRKSLNDLHSFGYFNDDSRS